MIKPMKAVPLKGEPSRSSVFEPKFDGHRVIVEKIGDTLSIYSRNFKDQCGKLPHLEAAFRRAEFDFIIDAEVVYIEKMVEVVGEQVPIVDFGVVQSVMLSDKGRVMAKRKQLSLIVLDALMMPGKKQNEDLTDLPDMVRHEPAALLAQLLGGFCDGKIMITPRWDSTADWQSIYEQILAAGGEGLMVKNPLKPYRAAEEPADTWGKLKGTQTADVVIIGYKPGQGDLKGLIGSIIFGQYKNGVLLERSSCSGMSLAMRRHFTENQAKYLDHVIEIAYQPVGSSEDSFRFPQFKGLRDDKNPEECVWDG